MQFAGRDFLKMQAPPGYKAGVGRGAVGFSTTAERATTFPAKPNDKRPSFPDIGSSNSRFEDPEEQEADHIFASIEAKRHQKSKRRHLNPVMDDQPTKSQEKKPLATISIDEWAQLPEATDSTRWNRRLRESEQGSRRMYVNASRQEQSSPDPKTDGSKRPALEAMIKRQPQNEEGYLQLAALEEGMRQFRRASQIIAKGTARVPHSERLWLRRIEMHPKVAEARTVATQACQALPQSTALWLKSVDIEPTTLLKLNKVHEALLVCPQSEKLWLLASQLESEKAMRASTLETALEFIDSPQLRLALAREKPETLPSARENFPKDNQLWFFTVKQDVAMVPMAVQSIERLDWLHEFIPNLDLSSANSLEIIAALVKSLQISLEEASDIPQPHRTLVFRSLDPSPQLFLEWSAWDPQMLDLAVQKFPNSDGLWLKYFHSRVVSNEVSEEAWSQLLKAELSSVDLLKSISNDLLSLKEYGRVIELLRRHTTRDEQLCLNFITAHFELGTPDLLKLVDSALTTWPSCAQLYIWKSGASPAESASQMLRLGLQKLNSTDTDGAALLWNRIAELEPSTTRKRALIVQALAKCPHSGLLWHSRIKLEKLENKPFSHALAEGLRRAPKYAPLWLEDLLATPASQRKKRLAEAVRQSQRNSEVLQYGAQIFASLNDLPKAREWLQRAGKSAQIDDILASNPFAN